MSMYIISDAILHLNHIIDHNYQYVYNLYAILHLNHIIEHNYPS
uniref:Uncharacterized protein n=1 Tax=Picea sitchensis TaxID=3332 RepID=C0PSI9_PICSI|nr:unknown [Picea sitchensis]